MISRRKFIGQSMAAAAAFSAPSAFCNVAPHRRMTTRTAPIRVLDPTTLTPFVDPLPTPVIARPAGYRPDPATHNGRVPFYRVSMGAIASKLHRDLPPTGLWSYGGVVPGVMFETVSGQGMLVEWVNDLPAKHFLPIDYTLCGAERDKPEVRSVVHLHGGKTPAESDGFPEDWYVPGQSKTYYYPNQQDGRCRTTITRWASTD